MPFKIISNTKNIGDILEENININMEHFIFLDWDDTVISTNALKNARIEFRNERERQNIVDLFKSEYDNKNCLGFYIVTYRSDPNEVFDEATDLGIIEYLKSEFICTRTDSYNRVGPIISVEYGYPKINVIGNILFKDFNKVPDHVIIYFVDDNYSNIVTTLLSNKYKDNVYIYFFPESNENVNISNNIIEKATKILKYLK